jgi:hypothetical protein
MATINERHRILIAAAVAAVCGPAARVLSIKPSVRSAAASPSAWTRQGRIAVQSSHSLAGLRKR